MKGETIILKAVVTNTRRTSKSQLVWTSNKDGRRGNGSMLKLNHLSAGRHIIMVSGYGTRARIPITIFQDLWALYQFPMSLHEISAIMNDFAMNWIDDSISGESWKKYEPPRFDQTSTDPSKLVFISKLRVLRHQHFDEPLRAVFLEKRFMLTL